MKSHANLSLGEVMYRILGAIIVGIIAGVVQGYIGLAIGLIAPVLLVSAIAGYCPIYAMMGKHSTEDCPYDE